MARLSEAEISQRLAALQGWRLLEGHSIVRDLQFPDFAGALAFVNRVAELAEAANHHPDILLHGWNKLTLTLCTHSEGGLTEADVRLAVEIDKLT